MGQSLLPLTVAAVGLGLLLKEFELLAFRLPVHDWILSPPDLPEPTGCQRLKGPVGAEDAVVLEGTPPVIITGELDAGAHEMTRLELHGTSASTSPRGTLWAIDRLTDPTPRLTRLDVPLPEGVSTMHSECSPEVLKNGTPWADTNPLVLQSMGWACSTTSFLQ